MHFQEKKDLYNSVIEQYRVYVKDGAIVQVVYTGKPDSAEKSSKTFTELSGEMKTRVQNLLRLARDMMNYTRSVENVPR